MYIFKSIRFLIAEKEPEPTKKIDSSSRSNFKSAPAPAKKPRLRLFIMESEKRKDFKMFRCIEAFLK